MQGSQHVHDNRLQPLSPAFACAARRSTLAFATLTVVVFGLATGQLLRIQSQRALVRQARVCAAALSPGRNGDLSDSVAALQANSDRVIAVATLDPSDNLHSVYPDRPAHRSAILSAIAHHSSSVTTLSPTTGEPVVVSAIVVPLNGSPTPLATKVLILLQSEPYTDLWLSSTAVVAILIAIMALGVALWLGRWFDRQVAQPLRTVVGAIHDPSTAMGGVSEQVFGGCRETAQVARKFEDLINALSDSDARTRRLERDAQVQIRRREIGFGRQLRRAKDQASTDPLTGLRNRTYLEEQLEPLYKRQLVRNAELAAVMIDVDNFKSYNDAHGHQVGDALLRFIGALLRGTIRHHDVAVRYGGDEFLLLLPGASAEQANAIADRLVKLFGQYTGRLGQKEAVSMSAGVASLPGDACESGYALVNRADIALYAAKRDGKNMVSTGPTSYRSVTTASAAVRAAPQP